MKALSSLDPLTVKEATAALYVRVLLADDNTVNQKVTRRVLERLGCWVDVASNGEEAIALARTVHYDVIFMGCSLPIVDGYAATQALRREESPGRRRRIVALTASDSEWNARRCQEAGMDDYVTKPVTVEYFRAALELSLKHAEAIA